MHAQRGLQYLVCVSVCLCVCVYDYSRTTGYEAVYERYQQLHAMLQGQEKECGNFVETTAFKRYGVKTSEKANMHNEHWLIIIMVAHLKYVGYI